MHTSPVLISLRFGHYPEENCESPSTDCRYAKRLAFQVCSSPLRRRRDDFCRRSHPPVAPRSSGGWGDRNAGQAHPRCWIGSICESDPSLGVLEARCVLRQGGCPWHFSGMSRLWGRGSQRSLNQDSSLPQLRVNKAP